MAEVKRFMTCVNEWQEVKGLGQLRVYGQDPFSRVSKFHRALRLVDPRIDFIEGIHTGQSEVEFASRNCPWMSQKKRSFAKPKGVVRSPVLEGTWINSIFSIPQWNTSYFHWHRNFLTHLALVLESGIEDIKVVISDSAPKFFIESLLALGLSDDNVVRYSTITGRYLRNAVRVFGLDRHPGGETEDYVRPSALSEVGRRIKSNLAHSTQSERLNFYIRRGQMPDRRVINESAVEEFLVGERGFHAVEMGVMTYSQQVQLFSGANQVIAMHGGGLTNLIFTERPVVLELAAANHGLRPDFFPFAFSAEGTITLTKLKSENSQNDVNVPIDFLDRWLSLQPKCNTAICLESVPDWPRI